MDDTRRILQQKIEEKMALGEMNELDPEGFEEQAFDMHSDAYQMAGIEDLPWSDIEQIAPAVETSELKKWGTWREFGEVAGPYLGKKTRQAGQDALDNLLDLF